MTGQLLILDDDLGFLLWLADSLAAAGFEPIPALNVDEAYQMLEELRNPIGLLVLNPAISGAGDLSDTVRRNQKDLPVLAILPATGDLDTTVRGVIALRRKPQVISEHTKADWVKTIRDIFATVGRCEGL